MEVIPGNVQGQSGYGSGELGVVEGSWNEMIFQPKLVWFCVQEKE